MIEVLLDHCWQKKVIGVLLDQCWQKQLIGLLACWYQCWLKQMIGVLFDQCWQKKLIGVLAWSVLTETDDRGFTWSVLTETVDRGACLISVDRNKWSGFYLISVDRNSWSGCLLDQCWQKQMIGVLLDQCWQKQMIGVLAWSVLTETVESKQWIIINSNNLHMVCFSHLMCIHLWDWFLYTLNTLTNYVTEQNERSFILVIFWTEHTFNTWNIYFKGSAMEHLMVRPSVPETTFLCTLSTFLFLLWDSLPFSTNCLKWSFENKHCWYLRRLVCSRNG